MHCAACAASIERRLNELDGVEATVNLATARATVRCERRRPGRGARRRRRVDRLRGGARSRGPPTPQRDRLARAAPCRLGCPDGARVAPRDDPGRPVLRLGVGGARAVDACRLLRRARLPQVCSAQRPPRGRDDGHADLARHARRVSLVRGRLPLRARLGHLLRGRNRGDHADPARALPRRTSHGPCLGGDREARRARRPRRARPSRRRRGRGSRRGASARRCAGRTARREDRHGWGGRRGRLDGRPLVAHRRVDPGRDRARGRGRRRDGEPRRPAARPSDEGGCRHDARPDPAARRGRSGGEGARPAARRPRLRRVRPGRDRPRARHAHRLARRRCAATRRRSPRPSPSS